jgi:LemA protein
MSGWRRCAGVGSLTVFPLALAIRGSDVIPRKQEKANAVSGYPQTQYQRSVDLVSDPVATLQSYCHAGTNGFDPEHAGDRLCEPLASGRGDRHWPCRLPAPRDRAKPAHGSFRPPVSEYRPNSHLKTQPDSMSLQNYSGGREKRIEVARQDDSEAMRENDTSLRSFPTAAWANTAYRAAGPIKFCDAAARSQVTSVVHFSAPVSIPTPKSGSNLGTAPRAPAICSRG